ncbi:FHA domain-containing protein [Bifidobacterium simiarum]|nr:FHA domain-containing protein [Bifidobacterium simiarum]
MRVDAGQHVVIGRKPLRPAPVEEGSIRLDVPDLTKSMSKRHARFSVADSGNASIEDLGSTNGTYVVRDDGELMRVPVNKDFLLPRSPMRFQFGDVPVDFVKVEAQETPAAQPVADLFSYAKPGSAPEPEVDPANMSVDDILDLRAGEPTGLLSTSKVRSRIDALHDQALADHAVQPSVVEPSAGQPVSEGTDAESHAGEHAGEHEADHAAQAESRSQSGIQTQSGAQSDAQSDTRADARSDAQTADGFGHDVEHGVGHDAGHGASFALPLSGGNGGNDAAEQDSRDLFRDAAASQPTGSGQSVDVNPAAVDQSGDGDQPAGGQTYAPVFEAGSVFDRLSKGELNKPEPGIVVDGFSSDDAKITRDFDVQFEMARHPQLLPFLAMNPSLYDDLYAWLEVQGDADIDRALAANQGYHEYQAVKGE